MTMSSAAARDPFACLTVDHVEFYVGDADARLGELVDAYGFAVVARHDDGRTRSVAVGQDQIVFVLTQSGHDEHPARTYVESHGDGVANIALGTPDARAAFAEAVRRGARPLREPAERGGCVVASIAAFGDVAHTFVQRAGNASAAANRLPPGLAPVGAPATGPAEFGRLDHFAVCLPAGELASTVEFYESTLGFGTIYEERIVVGAQSMDSKVVRSQSGEVTLTLIEPDLSRQPGQIDEFVKEHGGPGVQHIALTTRDIVDSVTRLRGRGVAFLQVPDAYYDRLPQRLTLATHTAEELREQRILADSDHGGQLFQIFARSTHPRRTFFFELIERLGARTFGSGNIKALYEAVELERTR
jgi:4-hydroxymandelate synthase